MFNTGTRHGVRESVSPCDTAHTESSPARRTTLPRTEHTQHCRPRTGGTQHCSVPQDGRNTPSPVPVPQDVDGTHPATCSRTQDVDGTHPAPVPVPQDVDGTHPAPCSRTPGRGRNTPSPLFPYPRTWTEHTEARLRVQNPNRRIQVTAAQSQVVLITVLHI
ncbi:hypothetical protein NHX12_020315 [Muraenolepis orangiensis]|uniref:Uncharacterized protein n=1 Tax=Muraenolepis orangiensis TaxID=630683 RepID=A0A9Q0ET97_9TELE|nr:hypothetical protein NHX12_020315 [Muraenolepis orangiensis]